MNYWFNGPHPNWRVTSIIRLKSLFRHGLSHNRHRRSFSPPANAELSGYEWVHFPLSPASSSGTHGPISSAGAVDGTNVSCRRVGIGMLPSNNRNNWALGNWTLGSRNPVGRQRFSSRRWAAPSSAPLPPRLDRGELPGCPPSSFVLRIAAFRAGEAWEE